MPQSYVHDQIDYLRRCQFGDNQSRADEIVTAYDKWHQARAEYCESIGLPAADKAFDQLVGEVNEIADAIYAGPATTLKGLADFGCSCALGTRKGLSGWPGRRVRKECKALGPKYRDINATTNVCAGPWKSEDTNQRRSKLVRRAGVECDCQSTSCADVAASVSNGAMKRRLRKRAFCLSCRDRRVGDGGLVPTNNHPRELQFTGS